MDAFCDEDAFTWFLSNATRINNSRIMNETGENMTPPIPIPAVIPVPTNATINTTNQHNSNNNNTFTANANANSNEEMTLQIPRDHNAYLNSYTTQVQPQYNSNAATMNINTNVSNNERITYPTNPMQKLQQQYTTSSNVAANGTTNNTSINNYTPMTGDNTHIPTPTPTAGAGAGAVANGLSISKMDNNSTISSSTSSNNSSSNNLNDINATDGTKRFRSKTDIQREKEEKLERRRARNRASARASRTRRLTREDDLCKKLKIYENENYDLKMRLKIGKDALSEEKKEKKQCIDAMMTLLKESRHTHRNNEAEIQQLINLYKHSYAEYGAKKKEKIGYHLKKMRQLLLPTGITNISFLSVEEGKRIIKLDEINSLKEEKKEYDASHFNGENTNTTIDNINQANNNGTKEKILITRENLWEILVKELGVTEEQQKEILSHQPRIQQIKSELQVSLDILNRLKDVTEQKNIALDKQIQSLQNILTPTQTSKFIIWIKQNPAFMYMLDQLVSSTIGVGAFKQSVPNNTEKKATSNNNGVQ